MYLPKRMLIRSRMRLNRQRSVLRGGYIILKILEYGFDVNIRRLGRRNPLICAVNGGNIETAMLPLKSHADIKAVDERQGTCLHLAATKDDSSSMTSLPHKHNPDIDVMDNIGMARNIKQVSPVASPLYTLLWWTSIALSWGATCMFWMRMVGRRWSARTTRGMWTL